MPRKKETEEEREARRVLREIVAAALVRPLARWDAEFGAPEVKATPGAILRVGNALLQQYGVPFPTSICVLRIDGDDAVVAPIRTSGKSAGDEWEIPERLSPFQDAMIIEVDCQLRLSIGALDAFSALARCPAAAELPSMPTISLPAHKRKVYTAWQALITSL